MTRYFRKYVPVNPSAIARASGPLTNTSLIIVLWNDFFRYFFKYTFVLNTRCSPERLIAVLITALFI